MQAILQGRQRVLLTMATGTGKTVVAFQICWKLWNAAGTAPANTAAPRSSIWPTATSWSTIPRTRPSPPSAMPAARSTTARSVKGREMYFAIYQAIAEDERRPGLYREYPPDFFDLIIVDECHRGSASDESNWREILEYFQPAYQSA